MKKSLYSLTLACAMLSPLCVAAEDIGYTNLTPNFEFNKAETPLQITAQAAESWNLPHKWIQNNIINGQINGEGGIMVLSGGAPITNNPTFYEKMNENARLIDLGGTCGKVWAMNWSNSRFKETLKSRYDIDADVTSPGLDLLAGWYNQYHYILIPDPAMLKNYSGQTLRCRIEMNIYKNEYLAENAFYGYHMDDQGNIDDADYTAAGQNKVKFSDFYTENQWDATKWLVYEFEFTVPEVPEDIAEWTTAPRIKLETTLAQNSCLMFRNISIFDPAEVEGLPEVDRSAKVFNTYTVGAAETKPDPSDPDDPENKYNNADDISGNTFFSPSFHFNKANAPLTISTKSKWQWNLPAEWVWQNFITGPYYEEGGNIALSGSYVITDDAEAHTRMNENIHLLDLGETCGKVWALNFYNTGIKKELDEKYGTQCPEGGFVPMEGWESKYNLWFIPDWQEMVKEAVNTVKIFRVRMEVNLFDNDGSEDMQLKAWGVNDVGQYSEGDVEYAISHPLKASEFVDENNNWDPTRWRAYEFDMELQLAPGVISEWRKAPVIKVDLAGCTKGTLLIRNIYIWKVDDSHAVSIATRKNEKWSTYAVKKNSSAIESITADSAAPLVTVSGNRATFTHDVEIFDMFGRKTADCKAMTNIELAAGLYVCRTTDGARTAKFAVR